MAFLDFLKGDFLSGILGPQLPGPQQPFDPFNTAEFGAAQLPAQVAPVFQTTAQAAPVFQTTARPAQAAAGTDLFAPQAPQVQTAQAPVQAPRPASFGPAPGGALGAVPGVPSIPAPGIAESIFNVDLSSGAGGFIDSFFNPRAHAARKVTAQKAAVKARDRAILGQALQAGGGNQNISPEVLQFLTNDPVAGRGEISARRAQKRIGSKPLTPLQRREVAKDERKIARKAAEHERNVALLGAGGFDITPERAELLAGNPELAASFIEERVKNPLVGTKRRINEATAALKEFERQSKSQEATRGFRTPVEVSQQEAIIRKEFTALTKPFRIVRDSFNKLKTAIAASINDPTGARDIAIVFSFMKMLDPNSVIRESEFATAENTAGVPDKLRLQYNKLMHGQRLAPKQRKNFLSAAGGLFKTESGQYENAQKQYRSIAKRMGINSLNAVPDFRSIKPTPSAASVQHMRQNLNDPALQKEFLRLYGEQALLDAMANQGPQ